MPVTISPVVTMEHYTLYCCPESFGLTSKYTTLVVFRNSIDIGYLPLFAVLYFFLLYSSVEKAEGYISNN